MAIFHFRVKSVSRGKGQSAVAKAAYNAREKLHDERTDQWKDYRNAGEVLFSGIFAPEDAPEWARDRERLWNEVEASEKRSDSQLAVEIEVALPHEFTDQQRQWLITDYVREEFLRKGFVADVNIHPPPREAEEGKQPNHHAHILVALREIGPEGFGERGLNSGKLEENSQQVEQWREKWENLVNRHLERHGFEERINRRTLEEQGIDREPTKHRGPAADAAERQGIETERGKEQPGNTVQLEETIRMYRGIGDNVASAQPGDAIFFSTDPERAAAFGQLHYVDITAAELAKFERPHGERFHQAETIAKNDWITADPEIIARLQTLAPERSAEPAAPIFDRDAAERQWMEKLTEAAIAHEQNRAERGKESREQEVGRTITNGHEFDLVSEYWQRIEDAIDQGGGFAEARRNGWATQSYGPDELEILRDLRTEVLDLGRNINDELRRELVSPTQHAALREIADELRDLNRENNQDIAMLALEHSAYSSNAIEMGRSRLSEFAYSIDGATYDLGDLAGGFAEAMGKYVDEIVDFFMTPSLPTPEVMHARENARNERAAQAEHDAHRATEEAAYEAQRADQERIKREQEDEEAKRKKEFELYPNERFMER